MDRLTRPQASDMDWPDGFSLEQSMQQIYRTAQSLNASAMQHRERAAYGEAPSNIFKHFPIPPNYFNVFNSAMAVPSSSRVPPKEEMLQHFLSSSKSDINPSWQNHPGFATPENNMSLSLKYQQILAKSSYSVAPLCPNEPVNFHNSLAQEKNRLDKQFMQRPRRLYSSNSVGEFDGRFMHQSHSTEHQNISPYKRQLSYPVEGDASLPPSNIVPPLDIKIPKIGLEEENKEMPYLARCSSPVNFSPPSVSSSHSRKSNSTDFPTLPALAPINSPIDLSHSPNESVPSQLRSPNLSSHAFSSCSKDRIHRSRSPSLSENGLPPSISSLIEKMKSSPTSIPDEGTQHDSKFSYHSHDTSCSDDSFQSSYSSIRQEVKKPSRPDNSFLFAHHDNFGITPERAKENAIGEPPDLIRISEDYGDYDDDDDDFYSDEEGGELDPKEIELLQREQPDVSSLTAVEVIEKIDLPPFKLYEPNEDDLSAFLDPQEIGHINYLIKCHADAVITIAIPSCDMDVKVISPLDYLDIHINGVLQIFFILFKCEDFLNFTVSDQISLLENGILPALISLGIPMFNYESKGWNIPSTLDENESFTLHLNDLLQIIPKPVVNNIVALQEASQKLNIDWTIAILMLLIFIYTPTDKDVIEIERIDKLRDKYIQIMLKYSKWRWGIRNAALLFPELLKFMDAIFKLCQEIVDYQLRLSDEEVKSLKSRLSSMNLSLYYDTPEGPKQNGAEFFGDVTYAALHSQLCALLICSMQECDNFSKNQVIRHPKLVFHEDEEPSSNDNNSNSIRILEPFRNTEPLSEPESICGEKE